MSSTQPYSKREYFNAVLNILQSEYDFSEKVKREVAEEICSVYYTGSVSDLSPDEAVVAEMYDCLA